MYNNEGLRVKRARAAGPFYPITTNVTSFRVDRFKGMTEKKARKQYIRIISDFFRDNVRTLLISAVSGALLGLSAPGFNLWFLAWFMVAPLIMLIALQQTKVQVIAVTFSYAFFYHVVYYSWFSGLHPLGWMGLDTVQSVLMVIFVIAGLSVYSSLYYLLFGLLTYYIFKLKTGKLVLIPLVWVVVIDIIASYGVFAFNWAMVQYSQYKVLPVIQVVSIIGGRGLEFVIILFNVALAFLLHAALEEKGQKPLVSDTGPLKIVSTVVVIFLLVLITGYGAHKLSQVVNKEHYNACVCQAAFPVEYFRSSRLSRQVQHEVYSNLIESCPGGLVVLPEGAIATDLQKEYNRPVLLSLKKLADKKNSSIVLGAFGKLPEGETNAVIAIDSGMPDEIPVYHKRHLVPFGEYTPFRDMMPEPIEKFASISSTRDFARGTEANVLQTHYGKVGVLLCYETIFPRMARELVANGANVLVNTSNLGWFHNSIVDQQFIAMCVLRAVENDRFFVVSINNGSSAIITPQGEIIARTEKNKKDFVSAKIEFKRTITFYTRWNLP